MKNYDDDEPMPVEARSPLHERMTVLDKRVSELEQDLHRMKKFMSQAARELGLE